MCSVIITIALAATVLCCFRVLPVQAKHDCEHLQNFYAEFSSELLRCAVQNAEPVTFCSSCVGIYMQSVESYQNLNEGISPLNESCWARYVDRDRLNLVLSVHRKTEELWTEAACSACFVVLQNGTLTNQTNAFTTQFFQNVKVTNECIKNHTEMHIKPPVCEACGEYYSVLNNLYNAEKATGHEDDICFDIRDAMNKTRVKWSKELLCCRDRHTSLIAFLVCSAVIGLVPVAFYSGFFVYQRRLDSAEYVSNIDPSEPSRTPPAVTTDTRPTASVSSSIDHLDESPAALPKFMPPSKHAAFTDSDDSNDDHDLLTSNHTVPQSTTNNYNSKSSQNAAAPKPIVLIDLGHSDDEIAESKTAFAKPMARNISQIDETVRGADDDDDELLAHPENVNRAEMNVKVFPEKELNKF